MSENRRSPCRGGTGGKERGDGMDGEGTRLSGACPVCSDKTKTLHDVNARPCARVFSLDVLQDDHQLPDSPCLVLSALRDRHPLQP